MEKIERPWGWYQVIDTCERTKVKKIQVNPGCSLSLQFHYHRAEHWVVVSGTALVKLGEKEFLLGVDQSTYVPMGVNHRLSNPGKIPLQ